MFGYLKEFKNFLELEVIGEPGQLKSKALISLTAVFEPVQGFQKPLAMAYSSQARECQSVRYVWKRQNTGLG
tara:strand:- start:16 stop:231 length:216 start_codon:yes stop_codon:yes gene_type:complete